VKGVILDNKNKQHFKVDAFIEKSKQWRDEIRALRILLLSCDLTESFKWGKPCYVNEDNNIVIIQSFKNYCALLFFKGILLDDPEALLVKTGENTHVGRQLRFTNKSEIALCSDQIKAFVSNAIAIEKSGIKVPKHNIPIRLTEELIAIFEEDEPYKNAFEALTPGRKRAYINFFSSPKQTITKMTRIAKSRHDILDGRGLNERKM